ncbi:MAG TPA: sugar-binding protein [Polyangiaceae bacterium]
MRNLQAFAAGLSVLFLALPALAGGRMITAEPMEGEKVRIDGDLREWPNKMTELGDTLSGSGGGDPRAAVTVGYDEANLYVVLKIFDKHIVRTAAAGSNEDHATMIVAFPHGRDFNTYELELYPGNPGKVAGVVKLHGSSVSGAKIVEAPSEGGLHVEAQIPWSAFPDAAKVRVGLRAAVTYTDADSPGSISGIIGTAQGKSGRALPPLLLESEEGLETQLLRPKNLVNASREAYGNVSGDGMYERVAVFGDSLAIVGPHYRGGKEFYFADLGVKDASMVTRLELVDFDGDGRAEIVVQKRIGAPDKYREVLTVTKVGTDDTPFQAFAQEVGIKTDDGKIENRVSLRDGAIEVSQGESEGFDPATYAEVTPSDMGSALLPWESVGSRSFKWTGKGFEPAGETPFTPKGGAVASTKPAKSGKRHHKSAAKPDEPPAPPAPRAPSSDELLDRVYALYRKDRNATGKPSFDFVTDVAGDRGPERVLVHGKDLVVFGKGFRNGLSYAFITIGASDPKDIVDVTARDLTGDGKAEIIVRAVLHAKASKALGGDMVERRALMIYGVKDDALVRIFGAETSRAIGDKVVLGAVAFEPGKHGLDIELRPARALGWTEQSYPFPADTTTAGGLEPLLLPWGDAGKRSYHWNGSAYVMQ